MITMNNPQEEESDNHPGKEVDTNGILFHPRVSTVGIGDARIRDEQGCKREPECAI